MDSLATPINAVSLPFLPGYSFKDPLRSSFPRSQSLNFGNGYAYPRISLEPISTSKLPISDQQLTTLDPDLIYKQTKKEPLDSEHHETCQSNVNKILKFYGYFKQSVHDSPDEIYTVRTIFLYYYVEDDSIMIMEPRVENSGLAQGKLLHRTKVPKNDLGELLTWKDLNIGISVDIFGRVYRLVDCDRSTAEYMKSEGIELNAVEAIPRDPYTEKRIANRPVMLVQTPPTEDKFHRFLHYDRKVLRFNCIWDDRGTMFGELRPYILLYFLADNTMEFREVHMGNDGRDPFPSLIHRQKIPKDRNAVKNSIPTGILEPNEDDMDWYMPEDLKIGKTINVFGRDFLLYDCDKFTQNYYEQNFGVTDFTPVKISLPEKRPTAKLISPYAGWGSLEDSLQSCFKIAPKPPKKDMIHMLQKLNVNLRYKAVMDSVQEANKGRRFVISVYPTDNTISIYEPLVPNSGFLSGTFLSRVRVLKPDSDPVHAQYYTAKDFYIGAKVEIFKHYFLITDEDEYVKKYRQEYPEEFGQHLLVDEGKKGRELIYETPEEAGRPCPVVEMDESRCHLEN